MSVVKLNCEFNARVLGSSIGCGEATTYANILVDKLRRAVDGICGTGCVRANDEDGRRSGPFVFVHRQAFPIRGVNRDRAPAHVGIHEPSHVEVDKHDQLTVAKRMDTKSRNAMRGSKAKVGDRVRVPAVCHELFEDAQ